MLAGAGPGPSVYALKMTHVEIALRFLECFCAADVEGLGKLLAPNLKFRGPLVKVDSARAYLAALDGSLAPAAYELHEIMDEGDEVVASYDYIRPESTVPVVQRFRFVDDAICEIRIELDHGNAFS